MRLRRLTAVAATAAATAVLSVPVAVSAIAVPAFAGTARTTVKSDRPSYTSNAPKSALPGSTKLEFRVDLPLRHAEAANAAVKGMTTPGSAGYRHYLSPGQFRDAYGPTQASVDKLSRYLKSQGLTVDKVSPTRTMLTVSGTAASAGKAFGSTLQQYHTTSSGNLVAPGTALSVPAGVAPLVAGVRGLAQSQHLNTPSSTKTAPDVAGSRNSSLRKPPAQVKQAGANSRPAAPPAPGYLNAPPCSTYYGEKTATGTPAVKGKVRPYVPCGYTPSQIQSAYGVDTAVHGRFPIDGRGTVVAITDAYNSPTIFKDASTYSARHGLPAFRSGQYRTVQPDLPYRYGYDDKVNGNQCSEQGWYGEQTLDVEAVHGVAPGASILYVPSRSCDELDFADALAKIVDGHLADEISNSWASVGENGDIATLQAYQSIFLQAALEGIGVYFSSGDDGDDSIDFGGTPAVDLPASNPLVTAVGGTSLAVRKDGSYGFEDGWGTGRSALVDGAWSPAPPGNFIYGGGGGASSIFDQPFYQQGVVPDSLATKAGVGRKTRVLPDVAMVGDPNTGYLVGQTQTFRDGVRYDEYRLGGTSLSSPLFAGIVAIADQASGFHHGFVNPALYPLVGSSYVHDPSNPKIRHYLVRNDYPVDPKTGIVNPKGDITTSLRSLNDTLSLHVRKGYDDVTGVGSPNGLGFLTHLGSPLGVPSSGGSGGSSGKPIR